MSSLAFPSGFMEGSDISDAARNECWSNLDVIIQQEFLRLASTRPSRSEAVEEETFMADVRFLTSLKTMKDFAASNAILKQSLDATLAAGDEVLASDLLESMGITRDTPRAGKPPCSCLRHLLSFVRFSLFFPSFLGFLLVVCRGVC